MLKTCFNLFRSTLILLLILIFVLPTNVRAAQHVVDDEELRNTIAKAKQSRTDNLQQVSEFMSWPETQRILKKSAIDMNRLQQATAQLTDEELASLAERSQEIQKDFAAGHLSNRELTILIVALAFAILIVAVAD